MKQFQSLFSRPKTFLVVSFIASILAQNLHAGGPGSTGAVELKIPVGPRAIAMGQAFVAVADDANAVYWNPAGLNQLGGSEITLQYDVFIETVRYQYLALATKLGKDASLGISGKLLNTGSENEIDALGNPTGNTFSESYMDIDLSGALRLNYYLDMGLTAKYISKSLAGASASSFAVDLGMLYRTPIPHLTAGFNIQNLGPGMKFDQVEDPLPLNFKIGLAYRMFDDNFTMAFDTNIPTDNAVACSLGGEYWYKDTLVGRFGYQFQGAIDQNQVGIGGKAGLYLGAGVKISVFGNYMGLDYAWTDVGFLGSNHHFALDFYF